MMIGAGKLSWRMSNLQTLRRNIFHYSRYSNLKEIRNKGGKDV